MKCVIFVCLLALASARPSYDDSFKGSKDHIPIIRDDRVHPDATGSYSFDVETGDGIVRSESGSGIYEADGAVGQQGEVAFTFPNGEHFTLKFVANENGYQPESPFLPVAPEFPHPIPDFVLAQIEKARLEDAQGQRYDAPPPSNRYAAP